MHSLKATLAHGSSSPQLRTTHLYGVGRVDAEAFGPRSSERASHQGPADRRPLAEPDVRRDVGLAVGLLGLVALIELGHGCLLGEVEQVGPRHLEEDADALRVEAQHEHAAVLDARVELARELARGRGRRGALAAAALARQVLHVDVDAVVGRGRPRAQAAAAVGHGLLDGLGQPRRRRAHRVRGVARAIGAAR